MATQMPPESGVPVHSAEESCCGMLLIARGQACCCCCWHCSALVLTICSSCLHSFGRSRLGRKEEGAPFPPLWHNREGGGLQGAGGTWGPPLVVVVDVVGMMFFCSEKVLLAPSLSLLLRYPTEMGKASLLLPDQSPCLRRSGGGSKRGKHPCIPSREQCLILR